VKRQAVNWFCILLIAGWSLAGDLGAATLFKGRRIFLGNEDNRVFKIGVTGTTAGYNYIALIEGAQQESVPLGDLGYWEKVDDPPSFLRNYDLQLIIKNHSKGKFKVGFEYDKNTKDINYRILEGAIRVKVDTGEYYPTLIIDSIVSKDMLRVEGGVPSGSERFVFFDFNSFDADLRNYYGSVKRILRNPEYSYYFYCYEAGNYDSYYFKTYQDAGKLDTDKMGLSLETGILDYYQKVLDNVKSLHGTDFAKEIVIVSRFGKKYSSELMKYANEIGMNKDMAVTFWSFDDIE